MAEYTVFFPREKKQISVEEGTNLLEAQIQAGLHPNAPCGGQGKCGKCLVRVLRPGQEAQVVKACCEKVTGDVTVETLEKEELHVLTEGVAQLGGLSPELRRLHLQLPSRRDHWELSEWERLCLALEEAGVPAEDGTVAEETVDGVAEPGSGARKPDLRVARLLARAGGNRDGELTVVMSGSRVLDLWEGAGGDRRLLAAAFDIGTTSIAGYLLDVESGEQLATDSAMNPQVSFGADVIQRADYALAGGLEELSRCVRREIDAMLGRLCEKGGARREDVYQVSLVGNSCMHHLFLGLLPESLVHAPYQPVFREAIRIPADSVGIHAGEGAEMLWLPLIAGFVGADTVGGLLATRLGEEEPLTLLIDIGTNGELVLGNRDRRIACSTAAGPALEGAKISCGMRGADGAIEHVQVENGQLRCQVIGGGRAVGICGSGLIDAIASLLEVGALDESGRLEGNGQQDGQPVYYLTQPDAEGPGVSLSQRDIREVQLAKGAIAAGIHLLAERLEVRLEDVERVYLAGAFGTYLNPESACRIGLIPGELRGRLQAVGNAAGEGAKQVVRQREAMERAQKLAAETEFLELASLPQFQDAFVDELEFPEGL